MIWAKVVSCPWPCAEVPGEGGDGAARLHPHHRALVGAEAAHLHVAGHADAEQLPVVRGSRRCLLLARGARSYFDTSRALVSARSYSPLS